MELRELAACFVELPGNQVKRIGLDTSASSLVARVPQQWHGPSAAAPDDVRARRVDALD